MVAEVVNLHIQSCSHNQPSSSAQSANFDTESSSLSSGCYNNYLLLLWRSSFPADWSLVSSFQLAILKSIFQLDNG